VYTTYTAHITIPNVYADDAPDALKEVAAYRNPFPTKSGPSLLPGRRHHVYNPSPTQDATTRLLQNERPFGSAKIGLRATAQAVKAVATTPATPIATGANARRNDSERHQASTCATGRCALASVSPPSNRHYRRPLGRRRLESPFVVVI